MKITTNLYLEIRLRNHLIEGSSLRTSGPEHITFEDLYQKLLPYIERNGDVRIDLGELNLSGYDGEVIKTYRTLREKVPFGNTITYGELGKLTGKHPRFVAYCMRINRFPVIIPCHRVLSKNGLGGFSYGLDLKERLLRFERGEV